jgi:CHASE2 domain-containing sensor protein
VPNYRLKADTGVFRLTGQEARLIHTITSQTVKRNWWLICLYTAITLAGVSVSYFLSGWISVAVSAAVALVTFLIGLRMMHQAIVITNEVR